MNYEGLTKSQLQAILNEKEEKKAELEALLNRIPQLMNELAEEISKQLGAEFYLFDANRIKVNSSEKWAVGELVVDLEGEKQWLLLIRSYSNPDHIKAWEAEGYSPFDLVPFIGYDEQSGFYNSSEVNIFTVVL